MSQDDRLAALLERATRERRGAEPEGTVEEFGLHQNAKDDSLLELGERSDEDVALVHGGEWLAPDPTGGRHRLGEGSQVGERPQVLTMPQSLPSVNLSIRPAAVVAIIALTLVVGGIFGIRWWWAEQASQPVPVAPVAPAITTPETPSASSQQDVVESDDPGSDVAAGADGAHGQSSEARAQASAGAEPQQLFIHVAGQVRQPGVVRVEEGARVQDAVNAAGGLGPNADTSRLNLARMAADGERLWVPQPGEEVPDLADGSSGAVGPGPPGGESSAEEARININSADQEGLEELPGVGPVTAEAIIQWRAEHGQFSTPDELLEVSGIGAATLEKLLPHLTL